MTDLQTSLEPVAADSSAGVSPDASSEGASPAVASSPNSSPRRVWRPLAETAGWVGLFAALFGGWAWYQTGSLSLIAPYLQGERLFFDSLHEVIENVPAFTDVEWSVRVTNRSSSPVTLLGSQPSCGCITLDEFPVTILDGGAHELKLMIRVPPATAPFEHTVKIFSDYGGYDSVVLSVSGTVP